MASTETDAPPPVSVLIVGAGLAGLAAGRRLHDAGVDVLLLDKGRGVGGRCATRRFESHAFDHGAQFFTVRDPVFAATVRRWEDEGLVREWFRGLPSPSKAPDDGHPRYCATQGMSAIPKHLAAGLAVRTSTRVVQANREQGNWKVVDESGTIFRAKTLLLTAPMPQTMAMLEDAAKRELLANFPSLADVAYEPCFSVQLVLDGPSAIPEPGALHLDGPVIAWISDNSRKRKGTGPATLTLHTSAHFAEKHLDASHDEIAASAIAAANPWLSAKVLHRQVHRWLYSRAVGFVGRACVSLGEPDNLVLAGDCMLPPSRIEGAFLSGIAAADAIVGAQPGQ